MTVQQTVSILGCGWLGLPLARRLRERGHHVRGSTTDEAKRPALEAAGVEPFLLRLDPSGTLEGDPAFFQSDVLFLNIPPGRRRPDVAERFPRQVAAVAEAAARAGVGWVIFAGSTSVYADRNRTVTEADAGGTGVSASGQAQLDAERILQQHPAFDTTILRFGGLYGYDRQPGRFLAGRLPTANADAPVNLIHQDDALEVVLAVLEQNVRGEVLNACTDAHPSRRDFYTRKAEERGLEPPTFEGATTGWKRVSNDHLKERLGYRFRHPDPLAPTP